MSEANKEVGSYAFSTRTAQTLNSGIFEDGSRVGFVSRFAQASPPQWNGTNKVS